MTQRFDVLAFGAHPDDVEVAMGGTIAKLSDKGLTTLLVDLCDGEPTRHASRGARQAQAAEAACRSLQRDSRRGWRGSFQLKGTLRQVPHPAHLHRARLEYA